jgi:geranylgeranyl reductase family protein
VTSLSEVVSKPTVFDAVIVGAGPSGSSCAYWLAEAGWSVCLIEKKNFPREKTCGDGLTPRSVHQLAQMGLEPAVAANGHRYNGLRAFGFGATLEMNWPEHPVFPNYGYTITRFNLDGLIAERAEGLGAVLVNGVEALGLVEPTESANAGLRGASGVLVSEKSTGTTGEVRGRYVIVADGQNSRLGRELGTSRNRSWPMGMALRGYYTSERHDEPWIDSHLDIRDPKGDVVPGYGWIFPLGDGRVNVGVGLLSTGGAWKGVNTTKLQEYFVAQTADAWGLNDESCCGPATGGRLPMGLALGPRTGANTLTIGDAAGTVNPFNGEGIAYGYETRRRGRGVTRQRRLGAGALRRATRPGLRRLLQGGARVRADHLRAQDPHRLRGRRDARRAPDEGVAQHHGEPDAQRQARSRRGGLPRPRASLRRDPREGLPSPARRRQVNELTPLRQRLTRPSIRPLA